MINFRFHLASLVAIFLALALGVVIGAGVIDRGVVDALDSRLNAVESRSDRIEGENRALRSEIDEKDAAVEALAAHAVGDRLDNVDVGIIAVRGVDGDRVDATVTAVQRGGGVVTGVLWLEDPWVLDDEAEVDALAEAIGSSSRRPATLRAQAWQEIATRLADPTPVPAGASTTTDGATDVLVALEDAGFVSFDTVGDDGPGLAQFPGFLASLVLVVGTEGDVPASDLVMPAANPLSREGLPLVVGDVFVADAAGAGERGSNLATLRDSDLADVVSTVDNLDRPQGPATAALALADLQLVPPVVGHYGVGPDTAPMPEPTAS